MNKYEDTLYRIYEDIGETEIGSRRYDLEVPKDIEILREAVDKANKYDEVLEHICKLSNNMLTPQQIELEEIKCQLNQSVELMQQIQECSSKDALFIYNNEHKRRMDLQLELEFEKEHKAEYEFWLQKIYEENKILREGFKTLTKHYEIKLYPMNIKYISVYMADIPQEDSVKIKSMLEVIENE